ncbi:hypothetical protein [Parasutterella excrementihominis]|uniref:hypothetical protein n=1 Tax=Parasutterella excrementihominis TaxID=487175 RepID=UPI0012BB8B0D|nr:hypothetical protein [Parasutterella excrementihominis]MTT64677.1 hypothetical protein [Parasutterella excrementihominis]MTT92998.1 hypothetical protein [Parasutterella excrementihominis]
MAYSRKRPLTDEEKRQLEWLFDQPVNDINELLKNFTQFLAGIISVGGILEFNDKSYFVHLRISDDDVDFIRIVPFDYVEQQERKRNFILIFKRKPKRGK